KLLTRSLHGEILNRDQVGVQGKLLRSGARKIRLNDVELRERLRPSPPRLQASDHVVVEIAEDFRVQESIRPDLQGTEKFRWRSFEHGAELTTAYLEPLGQHANHGRVRSRHSDIAADNRRIGIESGMPKRIANDDRGRGILLVTRFKGAAESG